MRCRKEEKENKYRGMEVDLPDLDTWLLANNSKASLESTYSHCWLGETHKHLLQESLSIRYELGAPAGHPAGSQTGKTFNG